MLEPPPPAPGTAITLQGWSRVFVLRTLTLFLVFLMRQAWRVAGSPANLHGIEYALRLFLGKHLLLSGCRLYSVSASSGCWLFDFLRLWLGQRSPRPTRARLLA